MPPVISWSGTAELRLPSTVLFGSGTLSRVPSLVTQAGCRKPLVVTDPGVAATGLAERLLAELRRAGLTPGSWDGCRPDPDDGHSDRCRDRLRDGGHDGVVALGGGSVVDTAKVAAVLAVQGGVTREHYGLERIGWPGLPLVAVPTIAGSGSEVSSHAVILDRNRGRKEVVSGLPLVPWAAVVDPETTVTAPPETTLHAALDGLVHAVEAFVARRGTPFTDGFVRQAVPRIVGALPRVVSDGGDRQARESLGLGCLFSAFAMANASAGAVHALGYPLTATYGLPHGLANAVVAPAALERLWPAAPARWAELALLFGPGDKTAGERELAEGFADRFQGFLRRVGVTPGLAGRGVPETELPDLARKAVTFRPILENTPERLDEEDLLAVYRAAWHQAGRPEDPRPPSARTRPRPSQRER